MEERRIVFKLGITYQTPAEQVKEVPKMVKKIIESTDNARLDRGHFSGFGSFSLDFEFVYFVVNSEYNVFMDTQQKIYFEILARFESEQIEFAYPTQTLFTVPSPKLPEFEESTSNN